MGLKSAISHNPKPEGLLLQLSAALKLSKRELN
jgi:hypothetical protein